MECEKPGRHLLFVFEVMVTGPTEADSTTSPQLHGNFCSSTCTCYTLWQLWLVEQEISKNVLAYPIPPSPQDLRPSRIGLFLVAWSIKATSHRDILAIQGIWTTKKTVSTSSNRKADSKAWIQPYPHHHHSTNVFTAWFITASKGHVQVVKSILRFFP